MNYECLIAGLPELSPSMPAPMSMEDLETLLEETLSNQDKEQLRLMKAHATTGACAFIRDWQHFNRDLNNLLTVQICRKHGLELSKHIIGAMPDDVDASVTEVSAMSNLYERERAIDALRFAWLEDRTRMVFFSLENVLAYYLELSLLCRWDILTREHGEQVFRDIVADFKKGIKL